MRRLATIIATVVLACAMACCIVACESQTSYQTFGTQSETSTELLLNNGTTYTLSEMAVKDSKAKKYGENLIAGTATISAGETARFYIDLAAVAPDATSYNVKITTKDDTSYELHNLQLGTFDQATLSIEEGVAYLTYTTAEGSEVNTLEDEKAQIKKEEQAADQAAGQPQGAGQAAAAGDAQDVAAQVADDAQAPESVDAQPDDVQAEQAE